MPFINAYSSNHVYASAYESSSVSFQDSKLVLTELMIHQNFVSTGDPLISSASTTNVKFGELSLPEIEAYIATGYFQSSNNESSHQWNYSVSVNWGCNLHQQKLIFMLIFILWPTLLNWHLGILPCKKVSWKCRSVSSLRHFTSQNMAKIALC